MVPSTSVSTKANDYVPNRTAKHILFALAEYRHLTHTQTMLVCGYSLASPAKVYAAREQLEQAGYVYKNSLPDIRGGTPLGVWCLDARGRRYVGDRAGDLTQHMKGNPERQQLFLEHTIAVNDVLIAFRRFEWLFPGQVVIEALTPDHVLKHDPIKIQVQRRSVTLVPDGWLQVKAFRRRYNFWLEVDRGTENRTDWNDKVAGIVTYAQALGETPMTVLILAAPGEQRRYPLASIRQWSAEKLSHMELREAADLFRFADSPEATEDLEGYFTYPRWSRPFDDEFHPLLPREGAAD